MALRRRDGSERWRVPIDSGFVNVTPAGKVVVVNVSPSTPYNPTTLLLDATSGRQIARIEHSTLCGVGSGTVILKFEALRAFDLRTGRLLWNTAFRGGQLQQCITAGHLVALQEYAGGIRVLDVRTGRLVLGRPTGLLLALRNSERLDICDNDEAIGLDARTGRERWRLPWRCDNDTYPINAPVISTEPLGGLQLVDSDSGRLLARADFANEVPGWGVLRSFRFSFDGHNWLFSGQRSACGATTRAYGPALRSTELDGQGLAVLDRTVLVTREVPYLTGCRTVAVSAFALDGRLLWSVPVANAPLGYPPVLDRSGGGTSTMVVGSTTGVVTAYAI